MSQNKKDKELTPEQLEKIAGGGSSTSGGASSRSGASSRTGISSRTGGASSKR